MKSRFETTSKFSFKEGNYNQSYGSGILRNEIYLRKENKSYTTTNQSDTIFWIERTKETGKFIKFEINKNKKKVLGIPCDELITYYDVEQ